MRRVGDRIELSASDLASHLGCRHLTQLDLLVTSGGVTPPRWRDPTLDLLQQRGLELEQLYLERLRDEKLSIAAAGESDAETGLGRTFAAMQEGVDVIYQATLRDGVWHGRADFLRRIERPSRFGTWSYEVLDAKLSRDTRAGTILQLCLYSHMLERVQGVLPERMHVVTPGDDLRAEPYRVKDFLAYHRLVQRRLAAALDGAQTYPEPVPQCDICRWWPRCDGQRREDDHLSLVAGISKLQIQELRDHDIDSLMALAGMPLPLAFKPVRGAAESYAKVREQARIQLAGRQAGAPLHEILPIVAEQGLCRLPEPSPGDVFLDLEGDPFVGTAGLEYLLGWATEGLDYHTRWAFDPAAERAAFEAFIDFTMDRWLRFPELHIYHFAAYEPGALKRLMGRYATRENELDRLLRAERFVDLHAVVRQAVRASVERYALKELEPFFGFEREIPLRDAALNLRALERAVELGRRDTVPGATFAAIEAYNRDDCISTMRLRDWLEGLRQGVVDAGGGVPRPALQQGDPSEEVDEQQRRVDELYDQARGRPFARAERARSRAAGTLAARQHARLAPPREEGDLVGVFPPARPVRGGPDRGEGCARRAGVRRTHRDAGEKRGRPLRLPAAGLRICAKAIRCTTARSASPRSRRSTSRACTIDIRKGPSLAAEHRSALFAHDDISDKVKRDSLLRLGGLGRRDTASTRRGHTAPAVICCCADRRGRVSN